MIWRRSLRLGVWSIVGSNVEKSDSSDMLDGVLWDDGDNDGIVMGSRGVACDAM